MRRKRAWLCPHPDREHRAFGLCTPCYHRKLKKKKPKISQRRCPAHKFAFVSYPRDGFYVDFTYTEKCPIKSCKFGWHSRMEKVA